MERTAEEQAREEVQKRAVEINDIAYEMESRWVIKLHRRGCSQQFRTCLTMCICGCVHHPRHGKGRAMLLMAASLVWLLYGNHAVPTCYTHINPSKPDFHTACARFPLQITCAICESPFLDFSTPVWGCDWAWSESGNCLKQYPFIPIFSFIYTTTENPFERDPKRYSSTAAFHSGVAVL